MLRSGRRLLGKRIGAVIVEFALVVPFLFLIVFGIIDFSRAYAQLNNINSSLREGARYGAAMKAPDANTIKAEVWRFSNTWANPLDTSKVSVITGDSIIVYVTNYPITLPTLGGFLRISGNSINATRRVSYRWERSCPVGGGPGCP
jgi:Flp pilus assembly protein TadG